MTIRQIRNSEIAKYLRCQRSWMLGYHQGLEPDWGQRVTPRTYDTGSAAHAGLRAYYEGRNPADGIREYQLECYDNLSPKADILAWSKIFDMAQAMVAHYPAWLDDEGLDIAETTLSLEAQMELPLGTFLGDEVIIYGTPDRIVRTGSGIVVEDWKTGDIDRPFMMESDWQLLNYMLMAEHKFGEAPVAARHRRLKRSMHTARAKTPQYSQEQVNFNRDRLAVHRQHLEKTVTDMVRKMQELEAGADEVYACTPVRIGQCSWDCSFTPVCSMMDDGADYEYVLALDYRKREDNR
jgi:RecB family exonuclease